MIRMVGWMLWFKLVIANDARRKISEEALPLAVPLSEGRITFIGEPCSFPFEYEGQQHEDCVSFNQQEWCVVSSGQWAVCLPREQGPIGSGSGPTSGNDASVVLNEIVHAPTESTDGNDWIEIKNLGEEEVDLTGYVLKDEKLDEPGFVIGETASCQGPGRSVIPAGGYLHLVRDTPCGFTFGLTSDEEVNLYDPQGNLVDSVSWEAGDAPEGMSWGRIPDGVGTFTHTIPTPLQPNVEGEPPITAAGDCCARIQGELPTFFTELPVVVIDTSGQELVKSSRATTTVCSCTCSSAFGCLETDPKDVNSTAGVRVRGNSSARDNLKKSFAVEFRDEEGEGIDAEWFGLSTDDDWVLYGPEPDLTFMRNFFTYHLGRESGEYAPHTKFVEVFLVDDGSVKLDYDKHYHGLYVAMDAIGRGSDRVDIKPLDMQTDPTGGFIFKYDNDNIDSDDIVFRTKRTGLEMVMVYPDGAGVWAEDLQPLVDYVDAFETALYSENFQDPENGYAKYIDLDAFINYLLVVEVSKNPDGYRGSTFMHKDRAGPLAMGPLWDYNEAYGKCCGFPLNGWDTEKGDSESRRERTIGSSGWRFDNCVAPGGPWCEVDPVDGISQWYQRLWEDPAFRRATAERWKELRSGPFSDAEVNAFFTEQVEQIQVAAERDYARWPDKVQGSFSGQVQTIRDWIRMRMAWMDEELAKEL